MLPSLFSLVALLSYITFISSATLKNRNSWRLSHGLPPARPRRFHASATETAHRRTTSATLTVVNGGDFESGTWTPSGPATVEYRSSSNIADSIHSGNGAGRLNGADLSQLASSITGLTSNTAYTLSCWIRLVFVDYGSCTFTVLVDDTEVDSARRIFDSEDYTNPYTWVQVTGTFTATTVSASIVFRNSCAAPADDIIMVDDVTVAPV
ncbi:hypothetical protein DL96DRAFT_1722355 [Flagelloscypha sp. PMI_526]|nr:hypothetical protein DL96DRAFT_1722355 [Flagelloscypha sp. PMI_526]